MFFPNSLSPSFIHSFHHIFHHLHPSMCSHSFLCVFNLSSNIIYHHNSTAANFQTRSTSNPCCNITNALAMSPWPVLSGLTASILILDFQPESRLSSSFLFLPANHSTSLCLATHNCTLPDPAVEHTNRWHSSTVGTVGVFVSPELHPA